MIDNASSKNKNNINKRFGFIFAYMYLHLVVHTYNGFSVGISECYRGPSLEPGHSN